MNTRSTPATFAAASMAGFIFPSFPGGVVMTISPQPAILAGMASISTVDGYAAVPPGTYRPTLSRGVTFWPMTTPARSVMMKLLRTCFSWNWRMF